MALKQTPFYDLHRLAGAKFGPFAGYEMPLFYPLGMMKEHLWTREKAGLFDISHMAHVEITGADAATMIERACPFHASRQPLGSGKYSFLMTTGGGIIDDLIVTRLGEERFLIVANAGSAAKDIAHLEIIATDFDAEVKVLDRAFLALQGPEAAAVLADQGFEIADMAFMSAGEPRENWFISRSGYTGEDGFEIALPPGDSVAFAEKLLADARVEWIGLGARDSLRLEAGLPLYGQDLSEEITPHEAGLIWAIPKDLREGGAYIGAAALAEKIAAGRKRKRVGLRPKAKVPARAGTQLFDADGKEIGIVTSGGFGPSVGGPVALGLIEADYDADTLFADIRGKKIEMARVKPPFVPHRYRR